MADPLVMLALVWSTMLSAVAMGVHLNDRPRAAFFWWLNAIAHLSAVAQYLL